MPISEPSTPIEAASTARDGALAATTITSASIRDRLDKGRWPRIRSFSPKNSSKPFTIRKLAATIGEANSSRKNFSAKNPIITAGIVAITTSRKTRRLSLT